MSKPQSTQTDDAREWSQWRRSNYSFFEKHLASLPETAHLVDIGAGPLQFRKIFKRFQYTGVDFVEYPDVEVVADLTKPLPLPDTQADIVTLSNVLEHMPEPWNVLRECHRILRPGGMLIGTVPFLVQVHQEPYDFFRYTNYELERLLGEAGFSEVSVVPLGNLVDAYDTMELKFFHHLPKTILSWPFRLLRRLEMRVLRMMIGHIPSNNRFTEGYGFIAYATGK